MLKTAAPLGFFVISILASVVGCSGAEDGAPLGSTSSSLVGGATDTGDPNVVLFETTGDQGGDCTAEFISTTVLLTAAHCALDENGKALPAGTQFRIYQGDDYSKVTDADWIYIDAANVHPNPAYDGNDNDITVLVLSKPLAVTPFAYNTAALPQSDVGQSVRLIGYGSNVSGTAASGDNGGFGLKRQLTTTIDDIEAGFVHIGATGANGCDGDSGGPALLTVGGVETIIALDSYSDQKTDCTGGDFYQRVDTQAAFIAQYMNAAPLGDGGSGGTEDGGATSGGSGSGGTGSGGSGLSPGDGTSSGDQNTGSGSSNGSSTSSGCAVAPAKNDATSALPWASVIALVAFRRRKKRGS